MLRNDVLSAEARTARGTPDLIRGLVVETKPKKPARSRKVTTSNDEDELGLVAAK